MDNILDKIKIIINKLSDKSLYDVRILGLVFVGLIALSVFWNGAKIIQQNYQLAIKTEEIRQENEVLELQNRNKELQNQYYSTDTYAELTARRVFGKAAPGESVYLVPQDVALKALKTPDNPAEVVAEAVQKPKYQKNVEDWLKIYFGE